MDSCTSARLGQVHTSPWLKANNAKPSSALSKNASSSSITSAKKILGDFPPSSSVTGIMFCVAYCMICCPTSVEPVNATFAIRFDVARYSPISPPAPLTTFTTPGGSRSPMTSISNSTDSGVRRAGFSTTQLPAARAGAIFQLAINSGKFHGIICPTTPRGSWK